MAYYPWRMDEGLHFLPLVPVQKIWYAGQEVQEAVRELYREKAPVFPCHVFGLLFGRVLAWLQLEIRGIRDLERHNHYSRHIAGAGL